MLYTIYNNQLYTYVIRQTADEYLKEYNRRRGNEYSRFHGYTYDGIWAVALAIQYVSQKNHEFLEKFQYRTKEWETLFLEALSNTSFEGVTGPVRFYNNERKASFQLNQFQNGEEAKIGEYSSLQSHLDLTRGKSVKWVSGKGNASRLFPIQDNERNFRYFCRNLKFSAPFHVCK